MESDIGEEKVREEKTASATEIEGLTEQAHKQFEHFVQGAHQMTACALAAIDACSADVPQTSQLLKLLTQQGSDRQTKQECLELLQSSFEKHIIAYEEEEQKHMHSLWGPMNTQQQDLQVRLEIGNQLHSLRLQRMQVFLSEQHIESLALACFQSHQIHLQEAEGWGSVTMAGAHVWTTISMIPYEHLRSTSPLVFESKLDGGTTLRL